MTQVLLKKSPPIKSREQDYETAASLHPNALMSAVLQSTACSIIVTDAQGTIQAFNAGAQQMLGYAAEDVTNRITPADFIDRSELVDRAEAMTTELNILIIPGFEAMACKAARGNEDHYKLNFICKDNSRFPVAVSITAMRDIHQEIIGYLLVCTDDTLRKADKAAELAAVQLAAIVESSSDAIVGKDLNSIVTSWNAAAERIFGYSAEEMIGRSIEVLFPPDHIDEEAKILSRIKHGERIEHFETERLHKNGQRISLSVTVSPIKDSSGKVIGASNVARDITERNRIAEKTRQVTSDLEQRSIEAKQLQSANGELEAFAYSVSHDLRAPLRSIDGFSQAILEDCGDKLDADSRDHFERIRRASQRMGQLIDDLLKLSRLTRSEMNVQPIDASKMAKDIADELRAGEPSRRVSFLIADGLIANADPPLLKIVLVNLLSNAWKFTGKSAGACIEFGRSNKENGSAFFIRDNGVGFDMAYAAKLFGAFQRLHSVQDFPGTGIGLVIVQRIIIRHGGRVWAESTVDGGATFYFTL